MVLVQDNKAINGALQNEMPTWHGPVLSPNPSTLARTLADGSLKNLALQRKLTSERGGEGGGEAGRGVWVLCLAN